MISSITAKINIVIIDSHPLLREGLKRVLETDEYMHIVAEGERGEELLRLYEQHLPDVVIMDTQLSHKSGIEALRELSFHYPNSSVLMFTVATDSVIVLESFMNGAAGYMLKEMDISSIVGAIKGVNKGEVYLHPKVTGCFISEFNSLKDREENKVFYQTVVRRPFHLLTPRETEILQLLSEGNSNRNMGEILSLSEKTVKNHVSAIFRKLELKDRTQAVVTALKNGWVELK